MAILQDNFIGKIIAKIKEALADKQDTLVSGTNIKTINGTSLLGSGDVSIEGGGDDGTSPIDEGRLAWSSEDSLSTLMDIGYLNNNGNKIAFIPPSQVTVEYSDDGGATWRDSGYSDANKIRLTTPSTGVSAYLRLNGSTALDTNAMTRVTIDLIQTNSNGVITWQSAFVFKKLLLNCSGMRQGDTHTIKLEYQQYSGDNEWHELKTAKAWGQPAWFSIAGDNTTWGYHSNPYKRRLRITWSCRSIYTNSSVINHIVMLSDAEVQTSQTPLVVRTGSVFSVDTSQNATFPSNVKAKKLITDGGKSTQVVKGDGSLIPLSELSPITDADAEILLDNHIHSINVNANGNDVNISVIESSKNGDTWETEDNDITIPLATTESAGVMSKEDKAKLDGGNVAIDDDSGMPDLIGDYYDDVDMVAEISLRQYYQPLTEGCLYLMNAIEGGSQCIIMFIYRSDGCIPISTTNTNTMKASISGTTLKITGTDGSGELRIKQIKLK